MSSEVWILEQDLCRCCHAQGIFNNLAEPRGRSSQKEIYYDMLKDSLDIRIDPVLGVLSEVTYTICEACILRLKDAFEFKKQVRKCEEKFKDFCNRNAIKVANENSNKLDVKTHQVISESLSDFRVDSFDDDEDDDDDFDIFNNFNLKDQTKSDTSPKLDSGSKQKVKNTTKPKAKTKSKQSRGKQSEKEEAADEKKKMENKSAEKKDFMEDSFNDDDDDDDDGFNNFDKFDSEDQIKSDTSPTLDSGSRQKVKITKAKAKTKSKQSGEKQSMKEEAADEKKKTGNKSAAKKGQATIEAARNLMITIEEDDNKYFNCLTCTRKFKKRELFMQHYLHVHLKLRPKLRTCHVCGVKFSPHLRAEHFEKVHGVPAPTCGACGKKFAYPNLMLRHQKFYHMGEKNYTCNSCDMAFQTRSDLAKHEVKHLNVRTFKCEFCDKSFKWKHNLIVHIKMHLKDKRQVCEVCQEAFVQQSSLKYHIAKRHPERV